MIVAPFVLVFLVVFTVPFFHYLLRKDGPAVAAVSLDRATFEAGVLPKMCCKTGGSADEWVSVSQTKWFRKAVEGPVPVSAERWASHRRWVQANRRSRNVFIALMIVGFPLQQLDAPAAIETALVVLVLITAVAASLSMLIAQRCVVDPRLERDDLVTLRGVHPDFVRAVQESRRDKRPTATADTP